MSNEKKKTRVSYEKSLRQEAKKNGVGLVTVAITFPDGTRLERQGTASASECQFAKWSAALLFVEEARPLPDLQELIRTHIQKGEQSGKKRKEKQEAIAQ